MKSKARSYWYKLSAEIAQRKDINASAKMVYALVANCQGSRESANIRQRWLAAQLGMSTNCVTRSISQLRACGLIVVNGKPGHRNSYTIVETVHEMKTVPIDTTVNDMEADTSHESVHDMKTDTSDPSDHETETVCLQNEDGAVHDLETGNSIQKDNSLRKDMTGSEKNSNTKPKVSKDWERAKSQLPLEFHNEEFKQAWLSWVDYRRQSKNTMNPATVDRQLKMISAWGVTTAIRSIDESITQGWKGLFEPKDKAEKNSNISRVSAEGGKYDNATKHTFKC